MHIILWVFIVNCASHINTFLSAHCWDKQYDGAVHHLSLGEPAVPALDHDSVLIEAVEHADLQINAGLNHPHRDADPNTPHLDRYLFEPTYVSSITNYLH